jgi:hypothetical protein
VQKLAAKAGISREDLLAERLEDVASWYPVMKARENPDRASAKKKLARVEKAANRLFEAVDDLSRYEMALFEPASRRVATGHMRPWLIDGLKFWRAPPGTEVAWRSVRGLALYTRAAAKRALVGVRGRPRKLAVKRMVSGVMTIHEDLRPGREVGGNWAARAPSGHGVVDQAARSRLVGERSRVCQPSTRPVPPPTTGPARSNCLATRSVSCRRPM